MRNGAHLVHGNARERLGNRDAIAVVVKSFRSRVAAEEADHGCRDVGGGHGFARLRSVVGVARDAERTEVCVVIEQVVAESFHRCRDGDRAQRRIVCERVFPDRAEFGHCGEVERRDGRAAEGVISDVFHRCGEGERRERGAALKRVRLDRGKRIGQLDICERLAVHERALAEEVVCIVHRERGERRLRKGVVADAVAVGVNARLSRAGNGDARKAFAPRERGVPDREGEGGVLLRQVDFRQRFAVHEGSVRNGVHGDRLIFHLDRLDVGKSEGLNIALVARDCHFRELAAFQRDVRTVAREIDDLVLVVRITAHCGAVHVLFPLDLAVSDDDIAVFIRRSAALSAGGKHERACACDRKTAQCEKPFLFCHTPVSFSSNVWLLTLSILYLTFQYFVKMNMKNCL